MGYADRLLSLLCPDHPSSSSSSSRLSPHRVCSHRAAESLDQKPLQAAEVEHLSQAGTTTQCASHTVCIRLSVAGP